MSDQWKVLVVDDEFNNRFLITEILKEHADCDIAVNGLEAIEAYNRSIDARVPYDVILMDISMPEMSGTDALKKIRQMEEERGVPFGKGVPIIMCTAHKEPFMESFSSGCDDYILKPIEADKLISKINEKIID